MEISQRHLRRRRKIAATEILDEEQQEDLVNKFTEHAAAQSRFYRFAFAVVLVVPSPAYVIAKHCRSHPKLSFMCLISLLTSAFTLKSRGARVPTLRLLNMALAAVIALQAWVIRRHQWSASDTLWLFPLTAAITAVLIERWFAQVQREINKLNTARYELRGV